MRDQDPLVRFKQWLGEYRTKVLEGLGASAPLEPASGAIRAVFYPSFHPEACVTIASSGVDGVVDLKAFESGVWRSGGTLPKVWQEQACIAADRFRYLCEQLGALEATALKRPPAQGLDGITLLGERALPSQEPLRFEAWSPRSPAEAHRFFSLIYGLARESLREPRAVSVLDYLHGYLDQGPSIFDMGGTPRLIRVVGRLTEREEDRLWDLFLALPADGELVVDLTGFEWMHRKLHALLGGLVAREGKTVFRAPRAHREFLRKIAIPDSMVEEVNPPE